ncbi:MAG: tetratricopeptide repeat protein [Bacteroidetes bacterium]|nr:tetratricopeptide repeat protein [Bacteroidota bacterium]
MVRLHVLGPAELRGEQGALKHSFLAGPKRLALLVYLALHRPHGFQRRDALLPLFWPERGQKSARNALSNMLYHMRKVLGRDVILNRGVEEIGVNREVLWCDALAFEEAVAASHSRKACELYRGELLEGLHVSDASSAFSQWLDREREHLRRSYQDALETLAEEAEQHGDHEAAVAWWRRRAESAPLDSRVTKRLMHALAATGNRTAAVKKARAHAQLLKEEFGAVPHEEVQKLTEGLDDAAQAASEAAPTPRAGSSRASVDTSSPDAGARAVAVLPFDTLGAAQTSFTDGMHGDLLTRLSSIADVQVISRTSVLQYRHATKAIHQIAQELGVRWVLEGEVQVTGSQVQVNARLVDAQTDRQAWAEDYRRPLTAENLFRIQEEITKEIAHSLKATLTPTERKQVEQRPTENLAAYRLCARGRRHLDERTEEGIRQAIGAFEEALDLDPEYVLAWVGLADALTLLHEYGYEAAAQVLPRAEQTARQALDLDPQSAEAHASLGLLHEARRRGPLAIRELQRAVELQPGYAEAHNWLSWVYQLLGHPNKALESAQRAVELNPLSPEAVSNLSVSHLECGNYEQALMEARHEQALGSPWGTGAFYEGLALYELGRFEEAKAVLRDLSTPWADVGPRATLALVHAAAGDHEAARAMLAEFEDAGQPFAAGLIHAALGDNEAAFTAFQRVERWGDYWSTLAVRHYYRDVWSSLREDPRYEALLHHVDRSWGLAVPPPAPVSTSQPLDAPSFDPCTIAVLPFELPRGSEAAAPLAAGLHDDLLTTLSRVEALTVIARSSVLPYRDAEASVADIARHLEVGTIVAGRLQEAANRVRLNVQLIDARDEHLRWAETYDRALTADNLFDIQSELAEKVASSLKATLSPAERNRVGKPPTDDLEAYRLYAQARRRLDTRAEAGIRQAARDFQRAIEQDGQYALAWAGLADALSLFEFYGYPCPDDTPNPMEVAQRAVELDSELGEAHAALGIRHAIRQDGPAALRALQRAVERTPSYAEAHIWLGWVLLCLGRPKKGLDFSERAVELNPLAPAFRVFLAENYLAQGRLEDALRQARRARAIQPEYGLTHFMEGLVLYHQGRLVAAASALQQALSGIPPRGTPTHAEVRAGLAVMHADAGDTPQARTLLDQIDETGAPFSAGLVYAALGDADAAFDAFERVRAWGTFETEHIRYFFPDVLRPLRNTPRYDALIRRVNQAWGLRPDGHLSETDSD